MAWLGPLRNQGVNRAGPLSESAGNDSISKFIQDFGTIQFLVVVGLRSLFFDK